MFRLLSLICAVFLLAPGFAEEVEASIGVQIDLRDRSDDLFHVNMDIPQPPPEEALFQMAAMVPGTYRLVNWGRFVTSFQAFDAAGSEIPVNKQGANTWEITEPSKLARLSYSVEDSYDARRSGVLPMAGTGISEDYVVLNPPGVVGYLRGQEQLPIDLSLHLPADWTAASGLKQETTEDNRISMRAVNFAELADSPLLLGKLQINNFTVDAAEITVAAFCQQGPESIKMKSLSKDAKAIVEGTRDVLGYLPVDRYAFLMFFYPGQPRMSGALEHNRSSLYFLPLMAQDSSRIKHVMAHEFFHIVTPLNIRSKHIDHFDFADPKAPSHLWFYEGVTEYMSWFIMRRAGIVNDQQFFQSMQSKFAESRRYFDDVSIIDMSENVLGKHANRYLNVYSRGALLAMALDLELRRLNFEGGLLQLVQKLIKSYGIGKPFQADEFFTIIAEHSTDEVLPFLNNHFLKSETPDYKTLLAQAGQHFELYGMEKRVANIPMLNIRRGKCIVNDKDMAVDSPFQQGDILLKLGDVDTSKGRLRPLRKLLRGGLKEGETITVKVKRDSEVQEFPITIAYHETPTGPSRITPVAEPSAEQKAFLGEWLSGP